MIVLSWRAAALSASLPVLALLGCSGPSSLTVAEVQASNVAWCTTGNPSAPTTRYNSRVPNSQAHACAMAALKISDMSEKLRMEQRGCQLDGMYCLPFVEEVENGVETEQTRPAVPGSAIEAVYRLCASNQPQDLNGVNSTPDLCYTAGRVARALNNRDYWHAFASRACQEGNSNGCTDLSHYFDEGDALTQNKDAVDARDAEKEEARQSRERYRNEELAEQKAETRGLEQQNAARQAAFGQFLGAMARSDTHGASQAMLNFALGNPPSGTRDLGTSSAATAGSASQSSRLTGNPTVSLTGGSSTADRQATAQRVGALCKTSCDREVSDATSTIGQAAAYRAAACEEACMYSNLPADWPGREQYKEAAEQNAAVAKSLRSK